jgi:hypothetical protein
LILLVPSEGVPPDLLWAAVRDEFEDDELLLRRRREFDPSGIAQLKVRELRSFVLNPNFTPEALAPASPCVSALAGWVLTVLRCGDDS